MQHLINEELLSCFNAVSKQEAQLSQRAHDACFMSLNILISYSRSLKVIRNYTLEYGLCRSLLVFNCNYVPMSRTISEIFRASNNGMTLKYG